MMIRITEVSNTERTSVDADAQLSRLRVEIERIDRALLDLIAERVHIGATIGRAKTEAGLSICDPAREAAVVRKAGARARTVGLDEEGVRQLYWSLVALSRRNQLDRS